MNRDVIEQYLQELAEHVVADRVVRPHREARNGFPLATGVVPDRESFDNIVSDYYAYHYRRCVAPGGEFEPYMAFGGAVEILDDAYRGRAISGRDAAWGLASSGLGGGLPGVLNAMAEEFCNRGILLWVETVHWKYVDPCEWGEQVEFLRCFLDRYGLLIPPEIDLKRPEKYARQPETLSFPEPLVCYVAALQRRFSATRRW